MEKIAPRPHFVIKRSFTVDLNCHGTDDQLELYARGKLPGPDVVVLEEHLLACASCVERLEETEQWMLAAREILSEAPKPETVAGWRSWPLLAWNSAAWFRQPVFGMAMATLALAVGAVVFLNGRARLPPVATLELAAIRGEMPTVVPTREIDLILTDAPIEGVGRIQVVDANGTPEWDGTAAVEAHRVEVKIQRNLKVGTHFVRLYGQDGDNKDAMLHEYGFRVQPPVN
jgi:hypothetical protein